MSGDSGELRNAAKIIAPHAGWITVLAAFPAGSQDLTLCGYQSPPPDPGNLVDILADQEFSSAVNFQGLLGRYVRFRAVTQTVGVIFGATQAAVTAGNAPVLTNTGVNTAGCCYQLAAGEWMDYWISTSNRWLGFVAAADGGKLIIVPSSVGGNG